MSDKDLFQLSMHVGLSYADLGQYDDAIAAYTDAINVDPENHWGYECRGHAYRGKFLDSGRNPENAKKALEDFTKAKGLHQEAFNICIPVGHTYMDLRQYDDAIVAYTEAIDITPKTTVAMNVEDMLIARNFITVAEIQKMLRKHLKTSLKRRNFTKNMNKFLLMPDNLNYQTFWESGSLVRGI